MSDAAYQLAQAMADAPFKTFAREFIRIEDRGEIVPLELNEAQLIVDAAVEKQRREGRPVRVLILKGRQRSARHEHLLPGQDLSPLCHSAH